MLNHIVTTENRRNKTLQKRRKDTYRDKPTT